VQDAASGGFSASALRSIGAEETIVMGWYRLAFTMTPSDLALA
jgi:hypothetical protein